MHKLLDIASIRKYKLEISISQELIDGIDIFLGSAMSLKLRKFICRHCMI